MWVKILRIGVLSLGVVACSDPQLTTPVSNLLVRDGEWLRFSGADIRRTSSSAIEFWEAGRLRSTIQFNGVEGNCASFPESLQIESGETASVLVDCGEAGGAVEARSNDRMARITIQARDSGIAETDAGEDVQDGGACSFTRLLFGETFAFQRTEPGATRVREFALLVEAGDSCVAAIALNDVGFRLLSTPTFDADAGRSIPLSPGQILRFGVEFSPVDYGVAYDATVLLPQNQVLVLSGESSPFCPRIDSGCPSPEHAVYLSTSDSLYILDGGAQKIGDFITTDGARDGIKDIAILSDGTFYAIGSSLYIVDPSSGTMRAVQVLAQGLSALESGPEPGQLLVGGENGVFALDADGQMNPLGLPMPVSGDIVRLDAGTALVTVRETPISDALFSLDLRSHNWSRICSLGVADVWGLSNSAQGPVGVASSGVLLQIDPATCLVNATALQGVWTGAAWW